MTFAAVTVLDYLTDVYAKERATWFDRNISVIAHNCNYSVETTLQAVRLLMREGKLIENINPSGQRVYRPKV